MSRNLHWKTEDIQRLNSKNGEKLRLLETIPMKKKPAKYRNKKCEYDGLQFDSKKEMETYKQLQLRLLAGELVKVECQYPMPYIVTYSRVDSQTELPYFEKNYKYIADFRITFPDNHFEIIDVKGTITREFKHKRMVIEKLYGIKIKIV